MKLITEVNEDVRYIVEEKDGKKSLYIEGVFLQSNLKNRNGRMYPSEIMEKEVNRYMKEAVEGKRAFGELGHPEGPTINLERVSHMIKSLKREGDNFVGRAKISNTPYGNIAANLMADGARLGVSTRGLGSLKEHATLRGVKEVQSDFHLATPADIVADPSAHDAFVHGVMEGKEWIWDNGIIKPVQIENYKKIIEKTSSRNLEEQAVRLFTDFIAKL